MTVEFLVGTPGSGKSYHALEMIIDALDKGKHVIANFPISFTPKMVRDGLAARFMYIPDEFLMGDKGMSLLYKISTEEVYSEDSIFEKKPRFYGQEGSCLVVIDEVGNYFPPEDSMQPVQKMWRLFFRQHRKLGYDFALISPGNQDINRSIRKIVEYEIEHRKANRVAPFKWLPFSIFFYVRYWTVGTKRQLLGSESSIFVKKFASLYNTSMMFGRFEEQMDFSLDDVPSEFNLIFGNTLPEEKEEEDNVEVDAKRSDRKRFKGKSKRIS